MHMRPGALALVVALTFVAWGAEAGDAAPLTGRILRFEDFLPTPIPSGVAMADTLGYLEYPEGASEMRALSVAGADADSRLLIVAPHSELLCGTGGCPYVVLDAQANKNLGEFFGSLVVLDRLVDRHPVLQVLSRRDSEYTGLSTHVYADSNYVLVSHALLDGKAIDDWRHALEVRKSEM